MKLVGLPSMETPEIKQGSESYLILICSILSRIMYIQYSTKVKSIETRHIFYQFGSCLYLIRQKSCFGFFSEM